MKLTPLRLLLMMCAGVFIAACQPAQEAKQVPIVDKNGAPETEPPPAMANGHEPPPIRHHAYELLLQIDGERPGYGLYTYVLFGRKVGANAPPLPQEDARRYQALLEAIESSTGAAADLEAALIPKEETNLFNIPAKSAAARPDLDNYHSGLALVYRDMALGAFRGNDKFERMLSSGAGPFLISTLRPLNQVRSPEPLLFADLSAHNPAAMREVVAAYKQRINRSAPDTLESFNPLRLALLNLILDADDHVTLIKNAVADWRDALSGP